MNTASILLLTCALASGCTTTGSTPGGAHAPGESAAHEFAPAGYPEPFGADLEQAWLDPWEHNHFSRRGTPFVHLFGLEPAFLDRDLFVDYRSVRGPGEDESELEVELEWALTRRLGLVVEVPYIRLDPDGASSDSGIGDLAIAPRALLIDTEAFLLSANLELAAPTGDEDKGLGSGETGLSPSLSAWFDLGNWVQVSVQTGTEHGLESGDAEVFYSAAVAYSFLTPSPFEAAEHDHEHGEHHFPSGLTSLLVEFTGRTALDGPDDGRDTAELLFGVSYDATETWEVRGGYQIPVGGDEEFDRAFVLSVIRHF